MNLQFLILVLGKILLGLEFLSLPVRSLAQALHRGLLSVHSRCWILTLFQCTTSKPFPLRNLPREIRCQIFRHCYQGMVDVGFPRDLLKALQGNPTLFFEALGVYYELTVFDIDVPSLPRFQRMSVFMVDHVLQVNISFTGLSGFQGLPVLPNLRYIQISRIPHGVDPVELGELVKSLLASYTKLCTLCLGFTEVEGNRRNGKTVMPQLGAIFDAVKEVNGGLRITGDLMPLKNRGLGGEMGFFWRIDGRGDLCWSGQDLETVEEDPASRIIELEDDDDEETFAAVLSV